ncbi:radical SAM/CxCxxxxC motif protein YfkAB [Paenibacillus thermoaerophilus]|uniref:Radical SAM/CxCxxxxC motif protein YfkAB n=1 Tax=Paenibacillus thermoaerophilus TaxID=1215385 RepID=A0ABW2V1H9_9BACL|nr:radical SAM/CxCxxxxC motif protein YfkAB [Paenibacillus thermoaerophilus]TMV16041.1 radical SAM/CxCxxxxC motif protein YfkAB [Paenibacillus thermoaerophilus]
MNGTSTTYPRHLDDPWDPLPTLKEHGRYLLTSVEMTVTNLCNMRCEHCAVGDALTMKEAPRLPVDLMLKRLDEVEHLRTISLTGGEPSFSMETIRNYMLPLLRYAKDRGVKTQINSNLTLDLERYEELAPYLDVMHISFNYEGPEDFYEVGFAAKPGRTPYSVAVGMYDRMIDNARKLSAGGLFVSAESMLNYRTHFRIDRIHRLIVEMGCRRHEVHPMYPSSFASKLPLLSLDEIRASIERLLDNRDPDVWMLFGTLPFFACSDRQEDLKLIQRLRQEPNVTMRGDPDGRNRLNVSLFTGDVHVTDFAALQPLGNIKSDRLDDIFERWLEHPLSKRVSCHCPAANCCGPNLLVADAYYSNVDFRARRAKV